jgi:hypothetical protein
MRRLAWALVGVLVSCKDPVDQAAKKRIFSPEDPPQAVAAASEVLKPENVADSVGLTRRVLGMGAAETTERIGPHTYRANISWEWSTLGAPGVRLKETRELLAGRGGVSGDFAAKLFNDRGLGLELMRIDGRVYARATYGKDGAAKFRERRRDRGMAERMREEAFGALRDFDSLFGGRLKLTAEGTSTVEGRVAWKYVVSLADAAAAQASDLPAPLAPKKGVDDTTARRLAFLGARQPKTLQGELFVDQNTSVVLRTKLDGRLTVAADGGVADLRLVVDSQMTQIDQQPRLAAPADSLADEDKPLGIAAALKRFGLERSGRDGGVAGQIDDLQDEGGE